MKISTVFIILGCLCFICCIICLLSYLKKKDSFELTGIYVSIFLFGLVAFIINGTSSYVYTIYGTEETDNIKTKYFLYYNAHLRDYESRLVLMLPFSKNCIHNDTEFDLMYYPIKYGEVNEENQPQLLPSNTVNKVVGAPSFFFTKVPSFIQYWAKRKSEGQTRWLVLKKDDPIEYSDPYDPIKFKDISEHLIVIQE